MSMEIFAAQSRYLFASATPMLVGLEDSHLSLEPQPGNKTAGWLLGHLCITGDFGRRLCGRQAASPKEWRIHFTPGTNPSGVASGIYPPMAELCSAFTAIYSDLPNAFLEAQPDMLGAVNPFEPARPAFPTARDFVSYILTGHLAYHIGQLGDWRRAAGLGHKGHM